VIQELTPQLLSLGIMAVVLLAPPLTLLLSALLLWRYRRTVLQAMAISAVPGQAEAASQASVPTPPSQVATRGADQGSALSRRLLRAPRDAAARVLTAGLAYALSVALALVLGYAPMRSLTGFALALWGGLWPVVPALALTVSRHSAVLALAAYLAPLPFILVAAWLWPAAQAPMFGGEAAAIRAAWSLPEMLRAWVVFNAAPTLALLLVLNRWTRAVGPLLLAFVSLMLAAGLVGFFAFATPRGQDLLELLGQTLGLSPGPLLALMALAAVASGALLGATGLWRVRAGHLSKRLNDISLAQHALWVLFAAFHGMFFALLGLAWIAAPLLAWLAYRAACDLPALRSALAREGLQATHGLIFLRVFSLGRRSEKLFDALSRQWRHAGSVQLITGPDLLHNTVQPHQLLDFVSGRLARHFIADAATLARRIDSCDRLPDRDGLFRVNSLFCHADTWESALQRLVSEGDTVLMDLRSFGAANAGCRAELQHLVQRVPLSRCVWVVDDSTDREFLLLTLHEAWQNLSADSPNHGSTPTAAPLHALSPGRRGLSALIVRLAHAA
jgi:hypothetical protein